MRFQGSNGFVHWLEVSRERYAYSMILPSMIILFIALLAPLMYSLVISLFDWPLMEPRRLFVGIRNYLVLLRREQVLRSLMITLRFVFFSVAFEMVLGVGIAMILNQQFKWRNIIRLAILLPMMASPAVVALSWRMILHADRGVLNYLVGLLGIDPQVWLGADWAFAAIVAVDVWRSTPFVILMILAGLQAIPEELLDAAQVDGASPWQTFIRVTVPLLRPVILVSLIFRTMFALRNFPIPWVLTGGGPLDRTNVIGIEIYRQGFFFYDMGMASALSWLLVILTVVLSVLYIRLTSREPL